MSILGMVETHDVFAAGPGWFILILARSAALRAPDAAPSEAGAVAHRSAGVGLPVRAVSA
jgi:hypothetical protein